ncbi:hypothetical protein [Argonema antarcticum]|uniref:hypothetical protein n=1 Tax=Argonema antarcticum TaxID=2942763 RepID=UPI0020124340|nr:hypothetical protein [Argonema antarcticum]MCL1474264.1 hypothetical protein [Argonema antarcticum A004/B2]
MTNLIVQVLGNSDVEVDGEDGLKKLEQLYSLEEIQEQARWNDRDFIEQLNRVSFPLVQKLYDNLSTDTDILFAFILTDQIRWTQNHNGTAELWSSVVTLDGIWWKNILLAWCRNKNIGCYPIRLNVEPNVPNGAADWEGMAEAIDPLLDKYIVFENNSIYFTPEEGDKIPIEKIIVQHSSGTPALSGALYLWGIEQKLAGKNIDFVYISEQEADCPIHPGKHWQWRLKVPQIRELLEIQDFSGALKLLDSLHPRYQELVESLSFLDRSVSLNLEGRNLEGKESIIERVSIALWSEKAFRDRSQWMHWYLRMAGSFELALYLLLEKQGNNNYQWENKKLIFRGDKDTGDIAKSGIANVVAKLLTTGELIYSFYHKPPTTFDSQPINDSNWEQFNSFYLNKWLQTKKECYGFNSLRNELFHNLRGDFIDKLLDEKTKKINGKVDHKEHPSQVAVDWLEYIIGLADLADEVKNRSNKYRDRISQILTILQ